MDDMICTGNYMNLLEYFKETMMKGFAMSDLGRMKLFLGVEVIQDSKGMFITHQKYATEILIIFGMENSNYVQNSMVSGHKMSKEGSGAAVYPTKFKQLIGSLRYLTVTRPDLIFSVKLVSRYMEQPNEQPNKQHMLAAKRILRYVQGTIGFDIQYKKGFFFFEHSTIKDKDRV